MKKLVIIPNYKIESKIYWLCGRRVMIDSDLADLYQVETKILNRAVKRNKNRFPEDFMFQLSKAETENLRFQIGTSSLSYQLEMSNYGGRRYTPYVFTEQGVAMLSSVLNSERAILVNIQIRRTFTKIREMLAGNKELREKIEKLERKYDQRFKIVFQAIKKLLAMDEKPKNKIGFRSV